MSSSYYTYMQTYLELQFQVDPDHDYDYEESHNLAAPVVVANNPCLSHEPMYTTQYIVTYSKSKFC